MSHKAKSALRLSMNPVALSSYFVAVCALEASVLGLPISHWPSGALAGVGGFYLIVGLLSRTTSNSAVNETTLEISRQTSGADNLVAEAVGATREQSVPAHRPRELVGAQH